MDDLDPPKKHTPLGLLLAEDLGPFSQDELQERIAFLRIEIGRCEARISAADGHRVNADALFKK